MELFVYPKFTRQNWKSDGKKPTAEKYEMNAEKKKTTAKHKRQKQCWQLSYASPLQQE